MPTLRVVGASRLVQRDKAICMIPGTVLGRDGIWLSYMGDMGACELKSVDADFLEFFFRVLNRIFGRRGRWVVRFDSIRFVNLLYVMAVRMFYQVGTAYVAGNGK